MGYILFAIGAIAGVIGTYVLDREHGAERRAHLLKTFQDSMNSAGSSISDRAEQISNSANDALHNAEHRAEEADIVFEPSGSLDNDLQRANRSSGSRTTGTSGRSGTSGTSGTRRS
jgi:hypothetical protein